MKIFYFTTHKTVRYEFSYQRRTHLDYYVLWNSYDALKEVAEFGTS